MRFDFGFALILIGLLLLAINYIAATIGGTGSGKVQLFGVIVMGLGVCFIATRILSMLLPVVALGILAVVAYRMFIR